jgi:hypothetical protein
VVVDAGGALQPSRPARDEVETAQRRLKAELLLDALAATDAVALSASDWSLGSTWVREQVAERSVPLLAANLTCDGTAATGSKVVERGGRRIGVVGVTLGTVEGCEVGDPGAALAAAVKGLPAVDAVIALVPATAEPQAAEILQGVPAAAAFTATGRYEAQGPKQLGGVWSFGSGTRGKHVGVLELAFVPGASSWAPVGVADELEERHAKLTDRLEKLEVRVANESDEARRAAFARQVPRLKADVAEVQAELDALGGAAAVVHQLRPTARELSSDVADHPEWAERVRALNAQLTERLGVQLPLVARKAPDNSPYLGADVCGACHEAEGRQWSTTPHARALSTLAADNHGADENCVGCHVTGYREEGGPQSPLEIGGFRDVQCEACHGPGRAHVANPGEVAPPLQPTEALCRTCHDEDNDMGRFDPATYFPKVRHGTSEPAAVP